MADNKRKSLKIEEEFSRYHYNNFNIELPGIRNALMGNKAVAGSFLGDKRFNTCLRDYNNNN